MAADDQIECPHWKGDVILKVWGIRPISRCSHLFILVDPDMLEGTVLPRDQTFCKTAELNIFFQITVLSLSELFILRTKEFYLQVSENRFSPVAASVHLPTPQTDFYL